MMKTIKTLFTLAVIVLVQFTAIAQKDQEKYDEYIQKAVNDFELPGLAISIVKDGQVQFQKAYGYENQPKQTELKTNSIFGIASLSKAFTATAIAMLVDDGKLNWDDRVQQHLKYFTLSDEYVASQMTIEDLLCHRKWIWNF